MKKQQGFTIIELVVVILLLGILTATALPRFMDVTDEAHRAVVDGVEGGLNTGIALYHAQWIAEGEPAGAAVGGFGAGDLWPSTAGYPVDAVDGVLDDEVDCAAIFNGLLQNGRPTLEAEAFDTDAETSIENATDGTDFVAVPNAAATPVSCAYYYVGQYREGGDGDPLPNRPIPTLTLTVATGALVRSTTNLTTD